MKRLFPLTLLVIVAVYLTSTGFQCGSAETTSAKLYMSQKNWAKAEESLLKEIAKNDQNEEAYFMLGQVRYETQKFDLMNEAFTRTLQLGQTHRAEIDRYRLSVWGSLFNEGVAYYNKGRDTAAYYDKALGLFSTAIAVMPDSANTYYVAALASFAKKDIKSATAKLETALQKNPNYLDAVRLLGQFYYADGVGKLEAKETAAGDALLRKTLGMYEKAYALDPNDPDNITNLIELYERLKMGDKAIKLTTDAVAKDPNNKVFRYAYGAFLLRQDKFKEATEQFEAAIKIDPNYNDAIYNLGVSYLNWGVSMKEESDKKYEADRKANKGRDVKQDFSYKEKFKEAVPWLEKAVLGREEDAMLWQTLGKVYANLSMTDKAKAAFEKFDKLSKQ